MDASSILEASRRRTNPTLPISSSIPAPRLQRRFLYLALDAYACIIFDLPSFFQELFLIPFFFLTPRDKSAKKQNLLRFLLSDFSLYISELRFHIKDISLIAECVGKTSYDMDPIDVYAVRSYFY
jgi:hypothetical protein